MLLLGRTGDFELHERALAVNFCIEFEDPTSGTRRETLSNRSILNRLGPADRSSVFGEQNRTPLSRSENKTLDVLPEKITLGTPWISFSSLIYS
jgi:hypothetical protein